jgi:adenine-specific DNA-methyltransferase
MDKLPSPEGTATAAPSMSNLEAFQKLFPGVVLDVVLDAPRLGELLDIPVTGLKDARERFGLMWAGRSQAVNALQAPSYSTLLPEPDLSINWDSAENVFIEGDNLEALKLLQKSYNDQVRMIYLDPPYNTGNDFVYNDDFTDPIRRYLEVTGQIDAQGNRLLAQTETSGRKHSKWLTMMLPRLFGARNLLAQNGCIFVSIDDNELHNLRLLMDEIFGAENYVTTFNWKKRSTGGQVANNAIIDQVEYILCYARNIATVELAGLPNQKVGQEKYRSFRKAGGQWERRYRPNQFFPIFGLEDGTVSLDEVAGSTPIYPLDSKGVEGFWENGVSTTRTRIEKGELRCRMINGKLAIEQLEVAGETTNAGNYIDIPSTKGSQEVKELFGSSVFENPKPTDLILSLMHIAGVENGDIVLDLFAGSGTTAHALARFNKETRKTAKFILVNMAETCDQKSAAYEAGYRTVSEITRERLIKVSQVLDRPLDFRFMRVGKSSFKLFEADQLTNSLFSSETLAPESITRNLVMQISLVLGQQLDSKWVCIDNETELWGLGDVLIQASTNNVAGDLIAIAKTHGYRTVAVLEDALSGKDALKANLYFAAKKANLTFKTF